MKLWKIVSADQWHKLNSKGYLVADGRFMDKDLKPAFQWLSGELRSRIAPLNNTIPYPQWSWVNRPDLREHRYSFAKGVWRLLEIEVPDEHVVILNLFDWVVILNNGYLSDSETESDLFDHVLKEKEHQAGDPYAPNIQAIITASWDKLFDMHRGVDENWLGKRPSHDDEAVFWRLELDQVISAREFKAVGYLGG